MQIIDNIIHKNDVIIYHWLLDQILGTTYNAHCSYVTHFLKSLLFIVYIYQACLHEMFYLRLEQITVP